MKFVVLLLVLIVATAAARRPIIGEELVKKIKSLTRLWTPYEVENNPFKNWDEDRIKSLFGLRREENPDEEYLTSYDQIIQASGVSIPDAYDFRTVWPTCVRPIRDQGGCGSCWAFGATEALSDRFCIANSGGVINVLSPQDMVSCNWLNLACDGGILSITWRYLQNTGVVSDDCFPYVSGAAAYVPSCPSKCVQGSIPFTKWFCDRNTIVNLKSVSSIQTELNVGGPLETGFTVYEDFMYYQSGIYVHTTGEELGGHAVEIVGYGTENGVGYWICANSWGENWGEKGYFRIAYGQCGVDSSVYGCTPKLN